jgi:hypothetical protein
MAARRAPSAGAGAPRAAGQLAHDVQKRKDGDGVVNKWNARSYYQQHARAHARAFALYCAATTMTMRRLADSAASHIAHHR